MKRNNLIVILLVFSVKVAFCQDSKYINFYAKEDGVGHAFVSLVWEDSKEQMTRLEGTWGLYPKRSKDGGKSFFIGEVPGEIRDDIKTQKDLIFSLKVNDVEYSTAIKIINQWKNKNYELLESDCLSFIIQIACIAEKRIVIPKRSGFENHPARYLTKLINLNKL